ncbi:MAG TPA: type II toxin-antitoxin system RelE/ParE family toxin [Terracidiphilus sp.]
MAEVFVRAHARRDILSNAEYLEEQGGLETAQRFLDATQKTFEALARMPKVGAVCAFRSPVLRRIRRWPVKGFENWLIFYLPRRNGVEIVHLIHGARDIESLFEG